MYSLDSYDGTGSLVYSLWNEGTASLGNEQGWEYNTTVLDGSGSLEVVTSSLHPYVTTESESGSEISMVVTWFSNNVLYDQSSSSYPILTDEQFGTSSFGLYAGDRTTYDEAVVIRVGDTEIVTEPDTAGNFVPRQGFHISQFSYNQNTNELLWYVDGYSGSATVNEDIDIRDITLSFNSSSLVSYPDWNPTYPSASTIDVYGLTVGSSLGIKTIEFTNPVNNQTVTTTTANENVIVPSTTTPVLTGDITSSLIGTATYYPSASLYPGRTSNYEYTIAGSSQWDKIARVVGNSENCNISTVNFEDVNTSDTLKSFSVFMENSLVVYDTFYTNVTQSFNSFNDCIDRPDVGLGDDSTFNLTAIYTSSLTWDEMRHNDDFLYPRY
jgi:hypothetical protein